MTTKEYWELVGNLPKTDKEIFGRMSEAVMASDILTREEKNILTDKIVSLIPNK